MTALRASVLSRCDCMHEWCRDMRLAKKYSTISFSCKANNKEQSAKFRRVCVRAQGTSSAAVIDPMVSAEKVELSAIHFYTQDLKATGRGVVLSNRSKFLLDPKFRSKVEAENDAESPRSTVPVSLCTSSPEQTRRPNSATSMSTRLLQNELSDLIKMDHLELAKKCSKALADISAYKEEVAEKDGIIADLEDWKDKNGASLSYHRITSDTNLLNKLSSYTGFKSKSSLDAFFDLINEDGMCNRLKLYHGPNDLKEKRKEGRKRRSRKLKPKDALVFTLFLLRTGCTMKVASGLFGISPSTASRYFTVARKGQKYFCHDQLVDTAKVARLRIHVERAFERLQDYQILHRTIPIDQIDQWGMVFAVCAFLCNFQPPLVVDK